MHVKHLSALIMSIGVMAWFSGCDCIPHRDKCQCSDHCCEALCQQEVSCPETALSPAEEKPYDEAAPEPPAEKAAPKPPAAKVAPKPAAEEAPPKPLAAKASPKPPADKTAAAGIESVGAFWDEVDRAMADF